MKKAICEKELTKTERLGAEAIKVRKALRKKIDTVTCMLNDEKLKKEINEWGKTFQQAISKLEKNIKDIITSKPILNKKTNTKEQSFGPYLFEIYDDFDGRHCVIKRNDGKACNPTFYEMQWMKNTAFGGDETAIEIFPSNGSLVDGQHQRHLWRMNDDKVPNLSIGSFDFNK